MCRGGGVQVQLVETPARVHQESGEAAGERGAGPSDVARGHQGRTRDHPVLEILSVDWGPLLQIRIWILSDQWIRIRIREGKNDPQK